MTKACLDTNVWISGILFEGAPKDVVKLALKKKFSLIISDIILDELQRNLIQKFGVTPYKARFLLRQITQVSDVYQPRGTVSIVPDLHDDNLVLETAWIGRAKYLVTGDKQHLLPLKVFRNIKIVDPTSFLGMIRR